DMQGAGKSKGPAQRKNSSILRKTWYTRGKIFKSGKVGGSDGRRNSSVPRKQGRSNLPGDTDHAVYQGFFLGLLLYQELSAGIPLGRPAFRRWYRERLSLPGKSCVEDFAFSGNVGRMAGLHRAVPRRRQSPLRYCRGANGGRYNLGFCQRLYFRQNFQKRLLGICTLQTSDPPDQFPHGQCVALPDL